MIGRIDNVPVVVPHLVRTKYYRAGFTSDIAITGILEYKSRQRDLSLSSSNLKEASSGINWHVVHDAVTFLLTNECNFTL